MISRVAENLYWMQRYVERAASTARLLQTTASVLLETPDLPRWVPVLIVAGEQPSFLEAHGAALAEDGEVVQRYLTWDRDCHASVYNSLRAARENARTTRETLSREVFQVLNEAWLWIGSSEAAELYESDRQGFYWRVRVVGHELRGAMLATMLRDEPLHVMELGLALERAEQTARALDVKHHALGPTDDTEQESAAEAVAWMATLLSCTAYEGYFKRYHGAIRGRRVAEFLVLDPLFPRSILFNLRDAVQAIERIKAPDRRMDTLASATRLIALRDRLEGIAIDTLIDDDIHEALTEVVDGLAEAGGALYGDFFDPPVGPSAEVAQAQ